MERRGNASKYHVVSPIHRHAGVPDNAVLRDVHRPQHVVKDRVTRRFQQQLHFRSPEKLVRLRNFWKRSVDEMLYVTNDEITYLRSRHADNDVEEHVRNRYDDLSKNIHFVLVFVNEFIDLEE